jgi:chaperonin GroES
MIQAILDKVIVHALKKEKSKGGLIIPDSVQEPQSFGEVLSVGEDVKGIEVGDVLIFHASGGMALTVGGKLLKCLMVKEIYGIVKSDEFLKNYSKIEIKQADLDELDSAIKQAQQPAAGGSRIIKV